MFCPGLAGASDATGRSRAGCVKSLTAEDRKRIVITVLAAVAANLLTVAVVGLAIIIAHNLRVATDTPKSYFQLIPVTVTPATVALIALSIVKFNLNDKNSAVAQVTRWVMIAVCALDAICLVVLLLAWVHPER
jgi:hypothetical protein